MCRMRRIEKEDRVGRRRGIKKMERTYRMAGSGMMYRMDRLRSPIADWKIVCVLILVDITKSESPHLCLS